MNITTAQVRDIRTEFATLKPVKVTLDGNRAMTVKDAVFALAPTLERMRKRGFDIQEIADKLHEKGIEVKTPTLAKYLAEFRRKQAHKPDSPAPEKRTVTSVPATAKPEPIMPVAAKQVERTPGSIVIRPDTPRDEL